MGGQVETRRRSTCLALLLAGELIVVSARFGRAETLQVGCAADPALRASALVAAITLANDDPDADTVELSAACTYTFEQPDNYWYGPNALPAIASEIVVDG